MGVPTTIGGEPARVDIELRAGEEVDFTVVVLNALGAAQDPTGWSATARVHTDRGATTLHTFTASVGVAGARVVATGDDTADWGTWGVPVARWELWLTSPAGIDSPHAAGWVRVTR